VPDRALRPRSGSSAKALLLTVLGEFVLPRGGSAWTQSLVSALGLMNVEEKNARQALTRVAEQGFIAGRRAGRRVRWELTAGGADLLTAGSQRIYEFGANVNEWDGHWLVVLCSVPEEQRAKRHQLRSRLGFAGFGFLSAGVAITPHLDREPVTIGILKDLGLVDAAVVLRAEASDLVTATDLLHRAWDLDDLVSRYRAFIRSFSRRSPATPSECFAALVRLVHEWRRFPFVDPEIPEELLPAGWRGHRAKALFDDRRARWSPAAIEAFDELEQSAAHSL
jgi:phenylacetic acid degradation operon negative regulatory protein